MSIGDCRKVDEIFSEVVIGTGGVIEAERVHSKAFSDLGDILLQLRGR